MPALDSFPCTGLTFYATCKPFFPHCSELGFWIRYWGDRKWCLVSTWLFAALWSSFPANYILVYSWLFQTVTLKSKSASESRNIVGWCDFHKKNSSMSEAKTYLQHYVLAHKTSACITYHCPTLPLETCYATKCQETSDFAKFMHLNVFTKAQLFLLSHHSFTVLETSSVSVQLGAFFCNSIKIGCLINISLLKSIPAGFYFPVTVHKGCMCSAYEEQNIEVLLPVYFSHMARKKTF